ncbi:Zn(2)-Cys(6) binuclear cluster domain-containing protein [Mycena pura]|uniref:Zn(2)-Cys(6) binuclear cluster domain-containing protein n=1 Tax=Mycena pura TaxID=153505 RepID=A0AAD6Y3N3_9AGAR|nr:Zn(2)-Cys(6) binuclear cluster domain-containing protein [Mycena pura]
MDGQRIYSGIPLRRGKACVNCRRRKIKCDGVQPMCGQCSRYATTFEDCEYVEEGLTKAQILEEQISILQDRIDQLENPNWPASSIPLSQPLSGPSTSASRITSSDTLGLRSLLTHFYLQQTSDASMDEASANSMHAELPFIVLQALVHNFLHNAACFGFFLDTQAFHDAVTSTAECTLPQVLLNVLCLWGVHLSRDPRITAYEPAFLAHALRSTAGSLAGTHPRTVLHSIQASVLLAYYFIQNARLLEGRYHTSAAVSIAVSAGLHGIHTGGGGRSAAGALPPPRDAGEQGERISAFWAVLNLNNFWASAEGAPSNISYGEFGLAIDTPWPLDTLDYVEGSHLLPAQSSGTVSSFLADVPDNATSTAALRAKVGILFEVATRLGGHIQEDGVLPEHNDFIALDRKIDAFTQALPAADSKCMLVVHMLCRGATIQLHNRLQYEHVTSRGKSLAAARAIHRIIEETDLQQLGAIDPVLAPLWASACLVFIAEIQLAVRRQRTNGGGAKVEELHAALNAVLSAMQLFASHCPLMRMRLDSVRQANVDAQIKAQTE